MYGRVDNVFVNLLIKEYKTKLFVKNIERKSKRNTKTYILDVYYSSFIKVLKLTHLFGVSFYVLLFREEAQIFTKSSLNYL